MILESKDFDKLLDMAEAVIDTSTEEHYLTAAGNFIDMVTVAKESNQDNIIVTEQETEFLSTMFGG